MKRKAKIFGITGLVLSSVTWLNAFSPWSLFSLLPTISGRREMLIVIAVTSIVLVLVAVINDSRLWLVALLPSFLLFGLLRLH